MIIEHYGKTLMKRDESIKAKAIKIEDLKKNLDERRKELTASQNDNRALQENITKRDESIRAGVIKIEELKKNLEKQNKELIASQNDNRVLQENITKRDESIRAGFIEIEGLKKKNEELIACENDNRGLQGNIANKDKCIELFKKIMANTLRIVPRVYGLEGVRFVEGNYREGLTASESLGLCWPEMIELTRIILGFDAKAEEFFKIYGHREGNEENFDGVCSYQNHCESFTMRK